MSVLIEGMEMPKDGCHHMICIYADGTVSTGGRVYMAVPVPPHGRLIDADAVERNLVKMQMAQKDVVGHGIRKSRAIVRDMPTIIPADKDGET